MKKLLIVLTAALTALSISLVLMAGFVLLSRSQPDTALMAESEPPQVFLPAREETLPPTTAPSPITRPMTDPIPAPTEPTPPPTLASSTVKTLYAITAVNVRQGPGTNYPLAGKLKPGEEILQVVPSKDGWTKVLFRERDGYVATRYLSETRPQLPEPVFTDSARTLYSTASLHVRSGPGTEYDKIGYFEKGDPVSQLAVSDTGWSRISYNGKVAYVSSAYLQAHQEPGQYQPTDEVVYAIESLNIYAGPGTEYETVGYLKQDEEARRIAVGDNGWSKLRVGGGEAYAATRSLTTQVPGSEDPPVQYRQVDETMVAVGTLILRSGPGMRYESLGTLREGSLVHRIAVGSNCWSIILLSGREVFVESPLLEREPLPGSTVQPETASPETLPAQSEPPQPEPQPSQTTPSETQLPETQPAETQSAAYQQVDELVVTTDVLNVRTGPGKEFERIGKLAPGTQVRRTAIGDDGWSLIDYQEQQAYVSSRYLKKVSGDAPDLPAYEEVDEVVWVTDSVTVRTGPGTEFETLGNLFYGEDVHRVGIGDNGWSRVLFDDRVSYVQTRFLTREQPVEPDFGETSTPGFPTPNSPFIYQYVDAPDQIPYAVFEPVNTNGEKPLPLILSLHGAAEVKKDRAFLEEQHLTKLFREWEYTGLEAFEAYVVCPHISLDTPFYSWGTAEGKDAIFALIDYLKENYNIDENRIILEGHSMGGQGALRLAADPRACFQKLVVVSGLEPNIDYSRITIPTVGCVGGGPQSSGPQDSPNIHWYMTHEFQDHFGAENVYVGPYTHDNVAIEFFKKDEDDNNRSDIIEWMLQ